MLNVELINRWIEEGRQKELADEGWHDDATFAGWLNLAKTQTKGKIGTLVVGAYYEDQGFAVEYIESKNLSGDLKYRREVHEKWKIVEVKISKCTVKWLRSGLQAISFWWNQIRPKKEWDEIVLVGVYPDELRIWRKSREEWDQTRHTLTSCSEKGHTGTNDLHKVNLKRNTRSDNFFEWEEIYRVK